MIVTVFFLIFFFYDMPHKKYRLTLCVIGILFKKINLNKVFLKKICFIKFITK